MLSDHMWMILAAIATIHEYSSLLKGASKKQRSDGRCNSSPFAPLKLQGKFYVALLKCRNGVQLCLRRLSSVH